ncbi:type ISP restriction/modification enzyme [Saccharothrix deserti]|uniref:type ISP restriction/modification enzyme n=1 Tax=Saccharothrix deserti TaxID=2593674 RepID=UPI001EE4D9D8|nr:type ISP restriction/modification enzyme [Saccharothrix deserti]
MIGETSLPDLSVRPDYAVEVQGARIGYVELKKPGYGTPETWSASKRDLGQWQALSLLPNVLYSDGERFARYSFGKLQGRVASLEPALATAGSSLRATDTDFEQVISDFLFWEPQPPRSLNELVRIVANLCRLLRDDVTAELKHEMSGKSSGGTFSGLAMDWRQALFPSIEDADFADQYSQTVTFALLLARVEGVDFKNKPINTIAKQLGKKHSLMGRALAVLTDQPEEEHSVALTTMLRVLEAADWSLLPENSYATLYEDFLAEYDPELRKKSGVYYTPASLVAFTTRFVDEILRTRLGRPRGFAERDVIVVDPAMGTGSFLAEVIDTVARTIEAEEGPGAVAPHLREFSDRLIGFENQAAPYAVAELRIHSLLKKRHRAEAPTRERRFLADTLADPRTSPPRLGSAYGVMEKSRDDANKVKQSEPVMVVIGNPPYADKAYGTAPWITNPSNDRKAMPSIDAFRVPGQGRLDYALHNKYVYFWRWATWKVFDAHPEHPIGLVAFVCSAGFTSAPGLAGVRHYLRETADEGWIIDLSPEGHQPPGSTRFFRGNQQPLCVAVFVRHGLPDTATPAVIRRASVTGTVAEKIAALEDLRPDSTQWQVCSDDWQAPFRRSSNARWVSMPTTADLMPWASPGVKPNRTWVYAPDETTLDRRWRELVSAPPDAKSDLFRETRDANLRRSNPDLPGFPHNKTAFAHERGTMPAPLRIGYRSFDRQWLIPDARLIATPRTALWSTLSEHQIFVVEQHRIPIRDGPALIFTSLLPDMHHYCGHSGGRTFPLHTDGGASQPNITPGLLSYLEDRLRHSVSATDVIAYIATVTAHPGFTRHFAADLSTPGVRIPLTANPELWDEAVRIGKEVIWSHTYGERFADPAAGRAGLPRLPSGERPRVGMMGIPDTEEDMPDRMTYDESTRTLHVGSGGIAPVAPEVWNYKVGGMSVVKHWFGYRKKNPSGNRKSPLDDIVPRTWTSKTTTELLDLLNVLGCLVALEPRQERLLQRVLDDGLITVDELTAAGVLPPPAAARKPPRADSQPNLFSVG